MVEWAKTYQTLMGWNQIVTITRTGFSPTKIRVRDFSVGVNQTYQVPELVTGATDRITWSRGVIEVGGSISAPLTLSFAGTIIEAANDAAQGLDSAKFTISSDVHGEMRDAMVNKCTIEAREKDAINVTAEIWGRLGLNKNSSTSSIETVSTTYGGETAYYGGGDATGMLTEQIPMFDQVKISSSFLPSTTTYLMPISVSFTIDNKLMRNYVLGVDGEASSLDCFSISAGQRELTGSMSFMSGTSGKIAYVTNVGMSEVMSDNALDFAGLVTIDGTKYRPLWSASPPKLNTQKVVIDMNYHLVATEPGFNINVRDLSS